MNLSEIITNVYPELDVAAFDPSTGIINLRDESDGLGAYIAKWEYDQPIPEGLTLGKPTA